MFLCFISVLTFFKKYDYCLVFQDKSPKELFNGLVVFIGALLDIF